MDRLFEEKALPLVLKYEGGFSDNPLDHGGATNKGIIQKVYDQYRQSKSLPLQSVKFISDTEVKEIYYKNYWLAAKCDKLGGKVAIIHFDAAVNSGIGQASKFLQRSVGAVADGAIGQKTLDLVAKKPMDEIAINYLQQRRDFYSAIVAKNQSQSVFLKGWLNRVANLEAVTKDTMYA